MGNEIAFEQVKNKTDNFQISIMHLTNGIYFLKATDDKGMVWVQKFVKE